MFNPKKMGGALQPWEYYPAAAGTYKSGQLVNAVDGVINPIEAASKTTPGYLCMADITVAEGGTVPVARVVKDAIYETQLSAEAADAKMGSMLEVSAGGLQVDAAATGTFEVTHIEDTEAGSAVCGRFH